MAGRSKPRGSRGARAPAGGPIERPEGALAASAAFGSDVVAETLRATGVPWIALNPGASFRGLHDSLVNFLGNRDPRMLLCLHEEHAVAIAQGWAKVTGTPMAVAVHSNVGLFHATMAIFNAWCDRMPVLILGATGPVDAVARRPWIDWIHTARDQGAIVRSYVKWDDQPASAGAARESVLRAAWIAQSAPRGPVYVNLDAGMQEAPLAPPLPPIDAARYAPPAVIAPDPDAVRRAAVLLERAKRPAMLVGRVSRDERAWEARVRLAERLGASVVTDLKVGAAFPTAHPQHAGAPGLSIGPEAARAIAGADAILSLDWVDLAGTLRTACGGEPAAKVVHASLDHLIHNGWSMDHQGLPPVDVHLAAEPDAAVDALFAELGPGRPRHAAPRYAHPRLKAPAGPLATDHVALALREAIGDRAYSLAHLPLSWNGASWPFERPLDFLGSDGGGGIGAGPGIGVGAALALRDRGILAVAVCGDGDFLMGATSLWTAVHYRIPLLVVVTNNRSFYNDEVHQERVARARSRPVGNKWIGQRIADPEINLAALGRAQGATGHGPVRTRAGLKRALAQAIGEVERGAVAVVDVRVEPGYTPAQAASTGTSSPGR